MENDNKKTHKKPQKITRNIIVKNVTSYRAIKKILIDIN